MEDTGPGRRGGLVSDVEWWRRQILREWQSVSSRQLSRAAAERQYISVCMGWHFYGHIFFDVNVESDVIPGAGAGDPSSAVTHGGRIVFAVGGSGIALLLPKTLALIASYVCIEYAYVV